MAIMFLLMECSNCGTRFHLLPGEPSIQCSVCHIVTPVSSCTTGHSDFQHQAPHGQSVSAMCPYNPAPHGRPSEHQKKRAVVCGVSYQGDLVGCVNDAKSMRNLLIHRFGFCRDSVYMLLDESGHNKRPTRDNILEAMHWLVGDCRPGHSLVFYFSGHGSTQEDEKDGDEVDGYDETICPLGSDGDIIDDEINAIMVNPLPPGVKLHAIIDACHSGTVLDLPLLCIMERSGKFKGWEDHQPRAGVWKGTNGGKAISFSSCDDRQYSIDTTPYSKKPMGAMTKAFIDAIRKGNKTYGDILNSMRSTVRTGNRSGGIKDKQEPQLTSNVPFDVYKERFSLS